MTVAGDGVIPSSLEDSGKRTSEAAGVPNVKQVSSEADTADRTARSIVTEIRSRFGMGPALATLLESAASGCSIQDERSWVKPRGVFPLPFVCDLREMWGSLHSMRAGCRRRAKRRRRGVGKTNLVLGLLNLHYGGLRCLDAALNIADSAARRAAVKRVHGKAAGWSFEADAAEVERFAKQPLVDYSLGEELAAAVDTDPELVKIPDLVADAKLLDLLPEQWQAWYANEGNITRGGVHEEAASKLRSRCYTSPSLREDEPLRRLVRRLWDSGMLRRLTYVRERVGLFTVARPDGKQRLIVDSRPTNEQWIEPPAVRMTSGQLLARQLQRGPSHTRRTMRKSDLSDFYSNLVIPSWMSSWFALPSIPGHVVGLPDESVDLGWAVLTMGGSHSVFLGQEVHMEQLRRAGLPMDRCVQDGKPLLPSGPFFSVVLDDFVAGSSDADRDGAVLDQWLEIALSAYRLAGLPVAEHKVEQDATVALGMELVQGVGAAPRRKRQRLMSALLAVANWPAVPARLLEMLIGHATWAFLFCRVCLSTFGAVFSHIHGEKGAHPLRSAPMAGSLRWELISAAVFLIFAEIPMSDAAAPTVLATDASPWGFGVCMAEPDMSLIQEALRFSELRGEYVSLDGRAAFRPSQGDRIAEQVPLPAEWDDVDWTVKMARPWRGDMIQAVGELQAAELAFELSARRVSNFGCRQLALLDARSAIGAIAKGRSSAWAFLRILRRIAALSLATGIQWCPRWIPGEAQPADEASRRYQPKKSKCNDWKRGKRIGEADMPAPPRRTRSAPVMLRGAHLAPRTVDRYLRAFLLDFYPWTVASGWNVRVRTVLDLENALMAWMEERHDEDRGVHLGDCVLYCIKLLSPRIYAELVDAHALLADWHATRSTTHWPPLTLPLVLLLVTHQLELGNRAIGVGFLVAFGGLLRVGELAALRVCDVVFPGDSRLPGSRCVVLILQHTKTGDDKSAELSLSWMWKALRNWVGERRFAGGANALLFPSAAVFRRALTTSLAALNLRQAGFVMHSFRAGRALQLVVSGVHMEEVLRLGRWRRPESARPYVQRLRALAAYVDIPSELLARADRLATAPSLTLRLWGCD